MVINNSVPRPKYKHIISMGFFCNVALELEKYGRRDGSYPFDWVISDIRSINYLIHSNFKGLFINAALIRNIKYPYIVQNKDLNIDFYHDFKPSLEVEEQIRDVSEKYDKRISRFYQNINEPTIFIRYIKDNEIEYWYQEGSELLSFLKDRNESNTIILIANEDVKIETPKLINGITEVFTVKRDLNDVVARQIIKDNYKIKEYILNAPYPIHTKLKNYVFYYNKKLRKRIKKMSL